MTGDETADRARHLADALRRGEDPMAVAGDEGIDAYRDAADRLREANRSPAADTDPMLLLADEELFVLDRALRRADALAALYEADLRRADPETDSLSPAAAGLAAAVWSERESLDEAIGAAATGWRVERMPPVDRCVLRIALWELRHRTETPTAVVIAEAVRLVKIYSTERSGGFVNGVLARLAAMER